MLVGDLIHYFKDTCCLPDLVPTVQYCSRSHSFNEKHVKFFNRRSLIYYTSRRSYAMWYPNSYRNIHVHKAILSARPLCVQAYAHQRHEGTYENALKPRCGCRYHAPNASVRTPTPLEELKWESASMLAQPLI
ncbi:hypothetical protein CEXT_741951 [Caerostris extrusa]|uniref:Uncharacterized protein n=1 Tax=Caerostris extrusa TaxID=172846 RepID=A0AAV4NB36_CAEEX|nr:hypothetical protein CEXT_741951 [Caerostris extrusa]